MDRIALISDVHGNLTALEAVLADIDRRGIARIFNLGDYVGKGPRGREVIELCRQRCEVNLLGNWDDFLPDPARTYDNEALQWWLAQLGPGQGEWLRALPFCHDFWLSGRRVRLFHATRRPCTGGSATSATQAEFEALFTNTRPRATARSRTWSATATPTIRSTSASSRVAPTFNTGSVGNCMGDPTPLYCILEGELDSREPAPWSIAFVRVPYDVEAELAVARELGLPQYDGYELELRHGLYRGELDRSAPASP